MRLTSSDGLRTQRTRSSSPQQQPAKVAAATVEVRSSAFTAAAPKPAVGLSGELAKNARVPQREVFEAEVRPMSVEEALAARRAAPSKAAFYATEPRFDSLQTFVRVSLEGHDLRFYAGGVPRDRVPVKDSGWEPDPTDLFLHDSYDLLDAGLQANVSSPPQLHKERRENRHELVVRGPWKPLLDAWPGLLETSSSKRVALNYNVIYRGAFYPPSVLGQLGFMGKAMDLDALIRVDKAQSFLLLHPDGSVQVKQNPGAHFVAQTLASGNPKVTVYRGESAFSARRVDYLKELSEGTPSAKTVEGLVAGLEELAAWLRTEARPALFAGRDAKAELKAISRAREMLRTRKDPRAIAEVLLRDINATPYLFTSVASTHASGFAHTVSKYVIDLSKLSPEAADHFHFGADNILGMELGPRFDTVDFALAGVKALERVA